MLHQEMHQHLFVMDTSCLFSRDTQSFSAMLRSNIKSQPGQYWLDLDERLQACLKELFAAYDVEQLMTIEVFAKPGFYGAFLLRPSGKLFDMKEENFVQTALDRPMLWKIPRQEAGETGSLEYKDSDLTNQVTESEFLEIIEADAVVIGKERMIDIIVILIIVLHYEYFKANSSFILNYHIYGDPANWKTTGLTWIRGFLGMAFAESQSSSLAACLSAASAARCFGLLLEDFQGLMGERLATLINQGSSCGTVATSTKKHGKEKPRPVRSCEQPTKRGMCAGTRTFR